jgi:protein ImuB
MTNSLWIALFLPDLSLQVAHRGLIKDLPLAISVGPSNRPVIFSANNAALHCGVRRAMTIAAARALCAELIVLPREQSKEQHALEQIAAGVYCLTPNTSLNKQSVLLEVSTTLRLFGGLSALLKRARETLRELGYSVVLGVAPTPLAAWLFAQARAMSASPARRQSGFGCQDLSQLPAHLAELPLTLFDWPRETLDALTSLAVKRVRDVLALPRDGVTKRFGASINADIDKALGRVADPRQWFAPPDKFFTRIELLAETHDAQMLLFPLRRMLSELQQFLQARGAGTDTLTIHFEHGSTLRTPLVINTSDSSRERTRWEVLIRERLDKALLPATVSALSLQVSSWRAYTPINASWLPDRAAQTSAWHALADRLASRLGAAQVFAVRVQDDHRPEFSWARHEFGAAAPQAAVDAVEKNRPLWLIEHPRALTLQAARLQYHGDLQFVAGPERIEAGWWDAQPARRDYFIARNPLGELVWVYRDLHDRDKWYLQGLFS